MSIRFIFFFFVVFFFFFFLYALRGIRNKMFLTIHKCMTHITYFWFFPYYCLGVKDELPALNVTVSKQNNSDCITVELGLFPTEKKKKENNLCDTKISAINILH